MSILMQQLNFDNAVKYHYDRFPPGQLNYERMIEPLARAIDAVARFDQMLKNMHDSEIFLTPLRNQEAVISSRMEGTVSTMDEILRYEAEYGEEDDSKSKVRSEVIETLLYQRALKAAQKEIEDGRPLSQWLIKAIHQKLLSFGRGASKSPGKFKIEQNYIADRTKRNILFVPISPEKLLDGLDILFSYIEKSTHQALIKIALSHLEFEALHPFEDGNGRIGRMLITLQMWATGIISAPHFYISSYLEENKTIYVDTMRDVSAGGDWTNWIDFFLKAIERQAIRNLSITEKIHELYEEMKIEFSKVLSSKWSVNTLDFVFTNPVFRNNKFTSTSGIPYSTAVKFAKALADRGLLVKLEGASGRRPALYMFEPLMLLVRV